MPQVAVRRARDRLTGSTWPLVRAAERDHQARDLVVCIDSPPHWIQPVAADREQRDLAVRMPDAMAIRVAAPMHDATIVSEPGALRANF